MTTPTKVTFKRMTASPALEARIVELTERLTHVHDGVRRCDVVVELPHRHHRRGRAFHVRVHLHLDGPVADVIVSHDPGLDVAHDDPYVAVRDAFAAARRQLQDLVGRQRDAADALQTA
ncbi:MAG TPA: HPF/RaiA family ribosome-associated protein [Kofleriaceae bacterium]|jgi:ribosome-associated translation inhibitor RaiA|nr:HPF/RaiA family ribosome-associated protein [Kofleriaceae bacterium]